MFNIPDFYKRHMSLDEAVLIMRSNNGVIIDMMENLDEKWELHCSGHHFFADDDEFFECWEHEVNAYNVIKQHMMPLFLGD